ncbi:MAG: fructosamine kinase family protein [Methylococcales bacterium]
MQDFVSICEHIQTVTGQRFELLSATPVAGGDINSAFCLQGSQARYFVKLNQADLLAMFEAELAGLQNLARTGTLRVPTPVVCGQTAEQAFLVLEYIEFGSATKASQRLLGRQLAQLHQQPQDFFGWHRDNTIGSTKQINSKNSDWLAFWREQRLGFQLRLAAKNGYGGKLQTLGERLAQELDGLFDQQPRSSLLHGDLWGGNSAVDQQGRPVIFDPACYFGDREADLAMTELFGGFSADFYAAYNEFYALPPGYNIRKTLYNLYHILNHLNLFGGGYLRQAENMLALLLAELR